MAKVLLNLGSGPDNPGALPAMFAPGEWEEVRVDSDPSVAPDFVASMADLSPIVDEYASAVYSSHALEHLPAHHVPLALAEIVRVLAPGGFALLTMPDLQAVAEIIADGDLTGTVYESALGPISALDIVYGHRASIAAGQEAMAHRTGFTADSLRDALMDAGFARVGVRRGERWDLWAMAFKEGGEE